MCTMCVCLVCTEIRSGCQIHQISFPPLEVREVAHAPLILEAFLSQHLPVE